MLNNISLRRKFLFALLAAGVVIVSSGMSIRLLSKAALFHHLERDHLAVVTQASHALMTVLEGGKSSDSVPKKMLIDNVRKGRQLAEQAVSELFPIEKAAFELIGFGEILRQPQAVIGLATRIENMASAVPGELLTPELAEVASEDLSKMREASDRFGPLVAEATRFIRTTALLLTSIPLAVLVAFLLLVRASTLRPMEHAMSAAKRMAEGDLSVRSLSHRNDEFGELLRAIDTTRSRLAELRSAR